MVCARDAQQRRSGSPERRVQPEESQGNRDILEAISRAKHAEEIQFLSIRAFHAHVLHQSGGQEFIGHQAKDVGTSQGRAPKAIQATMTSNERTRPSIGMPAACGSWPPSSPSASGPRPGGSLPHVRLGGRLCATARGLPICRARSRSSCRHAFPCSPSPRRAARPRDPELRASRSPIRCARLGVSACRCSSTYRRAAWSTTPAAGKIRNGERTRRGQVPIRDRAVLTSPRLASRRRLTAAFDNDQRAIGRPRE
jgi:hypothetical protein